MLRLKGYCLKVHNVHVKLAFPTVKYLLVQSQFCYVRRKYNITRGEIEPIYLSDSSLLDISLIT